MYTMYVAGQNEIEVKMKSRLKCSSFVSYGDSLVLHCASLLGTIFASLARANEHVHIHSITDFLQAKLASKINAHFLLNEHCKVPFYLLN